MTISYKNAYSYLNPRSKTYQEKHRGKSNTKLITITPVFNYLRKIKLAHFYPPVLSVTLT